MPLIRVLAKMGAPEGSPGTDVRYSADCGVAVTCRVLGFSKQEGQPRQPAGPQPRQPAVIDDLEAAVNCALSAAELGELNPVRMLLDLVPTFAELASSPNSCSP